MSFSIRILSGGNRLCKQWRRSDSSWNSSMAGNASLWDFSHVATRQVNAMKREREGAVGQVAVEQNQPWSKSGRPTGLCPHALLYCLVAIWEAAPKSRRRVCSEATAQHSIDRFGPGDRSSAGRLRLCREGDVSSTVAPHTNVCLFGMAGESFHYAEPRADFADLGRGFVSQYLLVGAGL
jgi:hypothetical protein